MSDMDARALLLLLVFSSLSGSLRALTCYECQRINGSGVCVSESSTCEVSGYNQCFLKKVFRGGQLLYAQQGCSDLCIALDFFRPGNELDLACCRNVSFCNKF